MIEKLAVKNFKSWANLPNMEFGKVTALFGANSSGKTSLIQLLLMLKQTVSSRDKRKLNLGGTQKDYVDLGSYQDIVYSHQTDKDISLGLSWFSQCDTEGDYPWDVADITLNVDWSYAEEQIVVKHLSYIAELGHEQSYFSEEGGVETEVKWEPLSVSMERAQDGKYSITAPTGAQLDSSSIELVGFHAIQPSYVTFGKNHDHFERIDFAFRNLSRSFEDLLNSIYYLGPLREYPHREYRWSGEKPMSVGVRGEYAVQAMLSNLVSEQSTELVDSANDWLQRLGMADRIDLRPIAPGTRLYEFVVRTRGYGHTANLADVGFGVSQVLPIIVLSHFAPPGSLLILEQPEIHLHPQVQTELADLFLETSLKRSVQFLIESHSEHLLMRLQRRLAERQGEFSKLTEKDVRLYFCKREANASVLEPLELDEFGRIKNWPQDFFGDAVAERRAMTEAMLERQMNR